ncbi:peptidase [Bacillus infantis]|uniref:peptidase n=1 Tax=Bacillus infantis TaxID=324767 RepID=UPI00209E727E|nr:peptidase [Bacillus infantis]MCP1159203.1 peptidase [Bacillus infantis]MCR6611623.1 peptidase [Bacillus infantis]
MSESDGRVKEWLNKNRSKGIRLLQRLVQEPSTRGNEAGAQAVIIEKCREMGLELDIWEIGKDELPAHPLFCSDRRDFSGNPNAVGVWKGTGGGRSIILNGHIDVVPEGSRDDWKYDPYGGHIKDGRLYGRGATDMKGGTVSLLLAVESLIASGKKLKGDVIFQSVIEEESGGAGTLAAVIRGYKADGAIIPEPTNMKLFPKQQGSMWFRITVKGRAAHGGTRYEGISAIEKAITVIASLQELEKKRNGRITDPLYKGIPIPIPINIGKITSGEWPSSVPDTAVIEGRIGVAPEENMKMAEKELEAALSSLSEKDEWFRENPCKIEWFGGRWQPGNLDIGHPLMNIISASYEKVAGEKPLIEASPWGTDGGILSKAGGTPVVVFGPGTTEAAHDADESISLDEMFKAAEIIAESIIEWCG